MRKSVWEEQESCPESIPGVVAEQSRQSMHRPRSRPFGYRTAFAIRSAHPPTRRRLSFSRVAPLSLPPSFHRTDQTNGTDLYQLLRRHHAQCRRTFRRMYSCRGCIQKVTPTSKTQRKTRDKLRNTKPKANPEPHRLAPCFWPHIFGGGPHLQVASLLARQPTDHPISASSITSSLLMSISECASTDRLYVIRKSDVAWRIKQCC